MRKRIMAAAVVLILPLVSRNAAVGADGVQVTITNDGTEDIMVTVYDMNTHPHRVVLVNTRINGFTSVPISLVGDRVGRAKLSWTATSADAASRKCGHARSVVGDDGTVNVHADSRCRV